MTLICFASQKGSPGATATALAVAAAMKVADGRRKVLLEADSTGGTLAIRYQLPVEPGLLTLAAAVRSGELTSSDLDRHCQELPGGLAVVLCPDGPEQVSAAMAASGARLGRFLSGLRDVDVICDVGRLAPESPALAFVAEASAVLMVARPTAEQLQPAARRMIGLRRQVSNIGWVLIGQKPYGPAEVESTYDFPVVGVIADDPRSVTSFESGVVSRRLRRHPFVRSSTTLAATLSDWLAPLTTAPAADADSNESASAPEPKSTEAEAKAGQDRSTTAADSALDPAASNPDPAPSPDPASSPDPGPNPEPDVASGGLPVTASSPVTPSSPVTAVAPAEPPAATPADRRPPKPQSVPQDARPQDRPRPSQPQGGARIERPQPPSPPRSNRPRPAAGHGAAPATAAAPVDQPPSPSQEFDLGPQINLEPAPGPTQRPGKPFAAQMEAELPDWDGSDFTITAELREIFVKPTSLESTVDSALESQPAVEGGTDPTLADGSPSHSDVAKRDPSDTGDQARRSPFPNEGDDPGWMVG